MSRGILLNQNRTDSPQFPNAKQYIQTKHSCTKPKSVIVHMLPPASHVLYTRSLFFRCSGMLDK